MQRPSSPTPFADGGDSSRRLTLDDLPDVALVRTFSFFRIRKLATNFAPVCSRWHRLSRDPILWTIIGYVDLDGFSVESVAKLFRTAPIQRLQRLLLHGPHSVDYILRIVAERCPRLQTLVLFDISGISGEVLAKLGDSSPGLSVLQLSGMSFKDKKSDWLRSFPNLKRLTTPEVVYLGPVDGVPPPPTIDLQTWDHFLRNGAKLVRLEISGHFGVPEGALIALIENRQRALLSLHIRGDHLGERFYLAVGECSKLTDLRIAQAERITVPGALRIAQIPFLGRLELPHTGGNLTEDCLLAMFTKPNFQHLNELNLIGCCAVTDKVACRLAQCCAVKLRFLDLSRCPQLTEKGAECVWGNCGRGIGFQCGFTNPVDKLYYALSAQGLFKGTIGVNMRVQPGTVQPCHHVLNTPEPEQGVKLDYRFEDGNLFIKRSTVEWAPLEVKPSKPAKPDLKPKTGSCWESDRVISSVQYR